MLRSLKFVVLVLAVTGLSGTALFAQAGKAEVRIEKFVLDNGLTVLITEMPGSPAVAVFGLVKTGSATEGKYLGTGVSHFLEHMLFKGTAKRGVGEIPAQVQAMGGQINASTSFDYTIYTLSVPQGHFEKGLDIIADMLMNSKFDPAEIEKEREVVYGEMRLYKDNPARYQGQMVFSTAYKDHPYRIPIIGHEELLRRLKRDDFVDYYRTHYTPDNTVLSIAGDVRAQEILPKIKAAFKDFERQVYYPRNLQPDPVSLAPRYYAEEYPTDLTRASLVYAGVSLLDTDLFGLDVLAMALGQGESSRLYKELFVKRGLVRSVSSSNFTPIDRGIFEVELVLDEKDLDEAVKAVKEQVRMIADKGLSAAELEKTKRQVLARHVMDRLTADGVAVSAAMDEAFAGDREFSKKYVDAVKTVTGEDIKRIARKYLTDERSSVVVLKPQKKEQAGPQAAPVPAVPQIRKYTLKNGMTVLLRENRAFPAIAVSLVLNGGTGQETAENNGISNLLAQVWDKGTKTRTAEQIAESVESSGASLSTFAGRNSFGLTFNLLSEDLDLALSLIEDLVKNPVFPEAQLSLEKEKVRTALISEQDQINVVTARHLRETLFLAHPFRLNPNGTFENLGKITRQDIVELYQRQAVPNNMVIAVYGDIDPQKVLAELEKRFGALAERPVAVATFAEAPPDRTRARAVEMDKKQAMIMVGFQGVDLKHRDRTGIEVMTALLGSSFSGRIFNTVREKFGQAYTLGGGFTPARDTGVISFYVLTSPDSVEQVKDLLLQIFADIRENAVPARELADMKTYLKGSAKMDLQTDAALGFTTALDELYGNGYDFYRTYDQRVDAVTAEDIKRLAKEYLDINKAVIIVTRPGSLKTD